MSIIRPQTIGPHEPNANEDAVFVRPTASHPYISPAPVLLQSNSISQLTPKAAMFKKMRSLQMQQKTVPLLQSKQANDPKKNSNVILSKSVLNKSNEENGAPTKSAAYKDSETIDTGRSTDSAEFTQGQVDLQAKTNDQHVEEAEQSPVALLTEEDSASESNTGKHKDKKKGDSPSMNRDILMSQECEAPDAEVVPPRPKYGTPKLTRGRKRATAEGVKLTVLEDWIIRPYANGLCVEGHRRSDPESQNWHSSLVVNRVGPLFVGTSSGTMYKLTGNLDMNFAISEINAKQDMFPLSILKMFQYGFPANWDYIVKKYIQENKKPKGEKEKTVTKIVSEKHKQSKRHVESESNEDGPPAKTAKRLLKKSKERVQSSESTENGPSSVKNQGVQKSSRTSLRGKKRSILKTAARASTQEYPDSTVLSGDMSVLPQTRSGRRVVPPLPHWTGARILCVWKDKMDDSTLNDSEIVAGSPDYQLLAMKRSQNRQGRGRQPRASSGSPDYQAEKRGRGRPPRASVGKSARRGRPPKNSNVQEKERSNKSESARMSELDKLETEENSGNNCRSNDEDDETKNADDNSRLPVKSKGKNKDFQIKRRSREVEKLEIQNRLHEGDTWMSGNKDGRTRRSRTQSKGKDESDGDKDSANQSDREGGKKAGKHGQQKSDNGDTEDGKISRNRKKDGESGTKRQSKSRQLVYTSVDDAGSEQSKGRGKAAGNKSKDKSVMKSKLAIEREKQEGSEKVLYSAQDFTSDCEVFVPNSSLPSLDPIPKGKQRGKRKRNAAKTMEDQDEDFQPQGSKPRRVMKAKRRNRKEHSRTKKLEEGVDDVLMSVTADKHVARTTVIAESVASKNMQSPYDDDDLLKSVPPQKPKSVLKGKKSEQSMATPVASSRSKKKTGSSLEHSSDEDEEEANQAWQPGEVARFQNAIKNVPADSVFYWQTVAGIVSTRTSDECLAFHQSLAPKTAKKQTQKPAEKPAAKITELNGGKGTLKRKMQLKQLIQQQDDDYDDDFFDSTPYREAKRPKISQLSDDSCDDFAALDFETPAGVRGYAGIRQPMMSAKKTPAAYASFLSPGVVPANVDRYIHQRTKGRARYLPPAKSASKQFTPVPSKKKDRQSLPNINISKLFSPPPTRHDFEDSDEEKDFYFSDDD